MFVVYDKAAFRCFGVLDKRIQDDTNDAKIRGLVENLEAPECCLILHDKHTGSYLTVRGTTVTGTVLAAT